MAKVFDTFAKLNNLQASSYRFCLDWERMQPTDTPESLHLEYDARMDVFLEQISGGGGGGG